MAIFKGYDRLLWAGENIERETSNLRILTAEFAGEKRSFQQ